LPFPPVELDLSRLRQGSVLVIGDVMVDTFVYGEVTRISPEAPIPVLSVREQKSMAGGAANVALNVSALGTAVVVVGLTGNDDAGRQLQGLIDEPGNGSAIADLVVDRNRPTTVKTRYIGNKQQILRADRESNMPADAAVEEQLISRVAERCSEADIVAVSDYGKGVLTDRVLFELSRICERKKIPLVIDPKRRCWDSYRGASFIKPNLQELSAVTGVDCGRNEDADRAAAQIVASLGSAILLTKSERGMSLYRAGEEPVHARAVAHEVCDVSGAGDTALATFSAALAAGLDAQEAMYLANMASGVAVTKLGTAIVSAAELAQAFAQEILTRPHQRVLVPEEATTGSPSPHGSGVFVAPTT
jgi:D-beta-D-heptose 7-phosphate kinase/D-beta-D-heptose 1-phosphate adenosyltransferase